MIGSLNLWPIGLDNNKRAQLSQRCQRATTGLKVEVLFRNSPRGGINFALKCRFGVVRNGLCVRGRMLRWECFNAKSSLDLRVEGRSSVVEQRPFKPKVVGSIPTAPTKSVRCLPLRFVVPPPQRSKRFLLRPDFIERGAFEELAVLHHILD